MWGGECRESCQDEERLKGKDFDVHTLYSYLPDVVIHHLHVGLVHCQRLAHEPTGLQSGKGESGQGIGRQSRGRVAHNGHAGDAVSALHMRLPARGPGKS